jgi:uncharacterized protein
LYVVVEAARAHHGRMNNNTLLGSIVLIASCASSEAPPRTTEAVPAAKRADAVTTANRTTTPPRPGAPNSVQFPNDAITMAGHLYVPAGFDPQRKYPAIVVVHPAGGVKEQTAGLYAKSLAEQGFITLAFDASHQGESGGEPRFLEDPSARVEDVRSAVDYLTTLAYVDPDRIGGLGICAGSGYSVKAASTEHRIKALATVSAIDMGAGFRKGWEGKGSVADQIATLNAVAAQRTAEAGGAEPIFINYVPETVDETTHPDMREAHEYYRTPGGHMHPNSQNKMLFTSLDRIFAFTGFDQVDTLLTQPLLVVAGSEAGSLWHSEELYGKAKGEKELFIIDGATHMDLYAGEHADQAVAKLSPFFQKNL